MFTETVVGGALAPTSHIQVLLHVVEELATTMLAFVQRVVARCTEYQRRIDVDTMSIVAVMTPHEICIVYLKKWKR